MHKTLIRAASSDDKLTYVMSDKTVDRYGDVIEPTGWDLKNFKANPVALFGHDAKFIVGKWADVRVEGDELKGRLELLPPGTSERVDEIRAAVEAGVLRAVSVGFRPIDGEPLPGGGGFRYTKSELMECSLVAIPANPNALQVAKSLNLSDEAMSTIFGEPADQIKTLQRELPNGGHADQMTINKDSMSIRVGDRTISVPAKGNPMKLADKITDLQTKLVAAKDRLTDHVNKSADGVMSAEDIAITDELQGNIAEMEASYAALKRAETALATRSEPSHGSAAAVAAPSIRRPLSVAAKATRPSDLIIRSAAAHAIAHATGKDIDAVLEAHWAGDEATFMVTKAAVAGATTTATGWAAELVNTAMDDFLEILRAESVYPALAPKGKRLAFGPNAGAIKIPSRAATPSIGGSFVGEGAPIPVRRLGLQSVTLSPKKMGVISVFSREIARYGTPAIEGLIRQEIVADTAMTIDTLLFDTNAGSAVRPAGLLNGVTALTPTAGGGYAALIADIKKLAAPFDAANAGRQLVLIMNPGQARSLRLTPNGVGDLGWTTDVLGEFQLVTSTNIAMGTVILMDAADFVSAAGDVPEFEVSDQAVLHMEDTTPLQIGTTGTPAVVAAPVQSMFQTAQLAVRMLMDITWAMRRTGMIQYMTSVTW